MSTSCFCSRFCCYAKLGLSVDGFGRFGTVNGPCMCMTCCCNDIQFPVWTKPFQNISNRWIQVGRQISCVVRFRLMEVRVSKWLTWSNSGPDVVRNASPMQITSTSAVSSYYFSVTSSFLDEIESCMLWWRCCSAVPMDMTPKAKAVALASVIMIVRYVSSLKLVSNSSRYIFNIHVSNTN